MAFFFPEAYSQIDWERGFDFLDAELQQITLEANTGKRIIDKLVKVYLKSGKEKWIVAHVEIQRKVRSWGFPKWSTFSRRTKKKTNLANGSLSTSPDCATNFGEKWLASQSWETPIKIGDHKLSAKKHWAVAYIFTFPS